ncbi:hypothetical protein [Pedobacter nyackensis]|uniref:hypothetical protein n=1 Tax=Pedobacter nyackensis TaxID=475255 RepID=UPI002930481F|nr:hypothetical protein [Pedobacter nyackensis]
MKNICYALVLSALLFSCQESQDKTATYTPRTLTAYEKFNGYLEGSDSAFTIISKKNEAGSSEAKEEFNVKFKDTLVKIQINKADPNSATDKFASAQFINTQKTTLLVQVADNSGLAAPCFLIALKDGKVDVASLYRPSTGKQDTKYTTGLNKAGRAGYTVNNDFFITNVNAQVYPIKRQNPEERIQGEFILNSPDKSTLVFLTPNSLYQVHYSSDETHNESFSGAAPETAADISTWVRNNFIWETNKKGLTYLKFNDTDRIVDIKEFQ